MSDKTPHSILFLSPYPVGCAPSQRFKYEQYYPHFEANGFSITTSSFVNHAFWEIIYKPGFLLSKIRYTLQGYCMRSKDLFRLRSFDIVYVHLWVTPFGLPLFEWLVRLLARKVIYDLDDMIYLGHTSEANRRFINLKGKEKTPYLIKRADHVIVSSPELFEYASGLNNKASDISSTVDTDRFVAEAKSGDDGKVAIGWTGTHSTSKYLHILDAVFQKLAKEIDFKLIVIGDESFQCGNIEIDHREWSEETEVRELCDIDIGLYPLPFEQWIMGKSGLKAITYMSMGIPCVAAAIGANMRVVEHEVTGYLVKTQDEWYDAIKTLAENPELRREMGMRGRQIVEEKFSIKSNVKHYVSVLNSLLEE